MADLRQTYHDFNGAVIAAHSESRTSKLGAPYAVQWPAGYCTVEYRKPSVRSWRMRIVCCANGREELA